MELFIVVLACILAGAFGGLTREIYSGKGLWVLPQKTDKTYALGSIVGIMCGIFAACLNLSALWGAVAQLPFSQAILVAISSGCAWGIAFNDIIANAVTAYKEKTGA